LDEFGLRVLGPGHGDSMLGAWDFFIHLDASQHPRPQKRAFCFKIQGPRFLVSKSVGYRGDGEGSPRQNGLPTSKSVVFKSIGSGGGGGGGGGVHLGRMDCIRRKLPQLTLDFIPQVIARHALKPRVGLGAEVVPRRSDTPHGATATVGPRVVCTALVLHASGSKV